VALHSHSFGSTRGEIAHGAGTAHPAWFAKLVVYRAIVNEFDIVELVLAIDGTANSIATWCQCGADGIGIAAFARHESRFLPRAPIVQVTGLERVALGQSSRRCLRVSRCKGKLA
jgi:hypothetical protein